MERRHRYETRTTWTGDVGHGTSGHAAYERAHETAAAGRPPILSSSDPSFRGDAARWNPELLLVASLSQCHMLWYLSLCAASGVVVVGYDDDASGVMIESADGGGRFESVTLRPQVQIVTCDRLDRARELHDEAARRCFIAASVSFPVHHAPVIDVVQPTPGTST